jgi:hypothetical protein
MKTAMQQAIKEIAYLWSSPGDNPNYTKIFEVLESKLEMEKQQIIETYNEGRSAGIHDYIDTEWGNDPTELTAGQYYEQTFKSE